MSFEFWTNAEQFYSFWIIVISVLVLFSVIVLIFVFTYAKRENRTKVSLSIVSFTVVIAAINIFLHMHYRPYLDQAGLINPLIRDREPSFIGYTYYGSSEEGFYSNFNDLESLRKSVLYKEERVSQSVTYLGVGDYFHYFTRPDGEIFKQSRDVVFNEDASQTQLVGSQFTLVDETFKEIGFKNPENAMFEYLEIPLSEQGKTYHPEYDPQIPIAEERLRLWNF